MADIEAAVFDRATTYAGLNALIGTRCYPVKLPQAAKLPAVTYRVINDERDHLLQADSNLAGTRMQFDVWHTGRFGAKGYEDAKAVQLQLENAFSRWSGTHAGVTVHGSFLEPTTIDLFEDDSETWHLVRDVMIWYYLS